MIVSFKSAVSAFCVFLLVALPVAPLCALAGQSGGKEPDPLQARREKFALLVGIDNYRNVANASGCVNDVFDLRDVLTQKYSFSPDHILALTDGAATREAIIDSFKKHLIDNAKKNSSAIIVFQFSGQGSKVRDLNGDEPEGYDETLIPVDGGDTTNGVTDITDDELKQLLSELSLYTSNITVIIDSSHSGGVRGDRQIRGISAPRDESAQEKKDPARAERIGELLSRNDPYVIISASLPHENAYSNLYETGKGQRANGTLTYHLVQALNRATPSTTYRDLFEVVSSAVTKEQPNQHPRIVGELDRIIFGELSETQNAFIKIQKVEGRTLTIAAGATQGLREGAVIGLYAPDATRLSGAENRLATATVTKVSPFTALAEMAEEKAITAQAKAVVLSLNYATSRLRVAMDSNLRPDLIRNISTGINSALVEIIKADPKAAAANQTPGCDAAVMRGKFGNVFKNKGDVADQVAKQPAAEEEIYYIAAADGQPLMGFFIQPNHPKISQMITQSLESAAKQNNLKALNNKFSPYSNKIKTSVLRVQGEFDKSGSFQPTKEESVATDQLHYNLDQNENYRLVIENQSDRHLYVTVFDLGTNGSIEVVEPRKGASKKLDPGFSIKTPIYRTTAPRGFETFKVIATTRPADFAWISDSNIRGERKPQTAMEELLSLVFGRANKEPRLQETLRIDEWTTEDIAFLISSKRMGESSIESSGAVEIPKPLLEEMTRLESQVNEDIRRGSYSTAIPAIKKLLELAEKTYGPEHPKTALYLEFLGYIYSEQREYAGAEALLKRSLAIREKVYGPEHPEIAHSLRFLAILYSLMGQYENAEVLLIRSLSISEKAGEPGKAEFTNTLYSLAFLYESTGQHSRALSLYRRALALAREAEDKENEASILGDIGRVYRSLENYEEALPNLEQALKIARTIRSHSTEARTLNYIGLVYNSLGEYDKAIGYYQQALVIRRELKDRSNEGVILNRLAETYRRLNRHEEAISYGEQALLIANERGSKADQAQALNNVAITYQQKGDYINAEQFYLRVLKIREEINATTDLAFTETLINLATLYKQKGDYERAEELYKRALYVKQKTLGPDHPEVATLLKELAEYYAAKGDNAEALDMLTRSNEIREKGIALGIASRSESEDEIRRFMAALARETSFIISFNRQLPPNNVRATRLALTTVLQRKGRELDVMSDSLKALRRRADSRDLLLLDELMSGRTQLASLVIKGPQDSSPEQYRANVKKLEQNLERIEAAVSARNDVFRAQSEPVSIARVQQRIPFDAALVEYVLYEPAVKLGNNDSKPHYIVYVLKHEGEPAWVDLGEASIIDESVTQLRKALSDLSGDYKKLSRAVYEKVMQPVLKLIAPARTLLLAPDSSLNLIPFEALLDKNNEYLIERYSLSYLTTGRDLLRFEDTAAARQEPAIFANPAFDYTGANDGARASGQDNANRRSKDYVRFQALGSAEQEAQALAKLLPDVRVFTGRLATESALKQVHGPGILHIATHGFFLPDQLETPISSGNNPIGENPLLRSGLVLSGANKRRSGSEDGVLTALEASGLDLWGTKLIVISGCETGVGSTRNGEGVYGMRRAFAIAGAESQITSLWRVDDLATRDLMAAFYERLLAGKGRREALRQAQLMRLKAKSPSNHPYYWAGFILSGQWTSLDLKDIKPTEIKR